MPSIQITKQQAEVLTLFSQQQAIAAQQVQAALLAIFAGHGILKFKNTQLNGDTLSYETVE